MNSATAVLAIMSVTGFAAAASPAYADDYTSYLNPTTHMVVRAMFPEKVHQYIACHLYQSTRAPTYLSDCASFYHEGDGDFVKAKMFAQAMVRAQLKPVIYSPNGTDLVGDGTGDDVVFPELTSFNRTMEIIITGYFPANVQPLVRCALFAAGSSSIEKVEEMAQSTCANIGPKADPIGGPAAFGFAYAVARQLTKKNVGLDERNPIGMTVFSGKRTRE